MDSLIFSFKFLNEHGQATSSAIEAELTRKTLFLGDTKIGLGRIARVLRRGKRFLIQFHEPDKPEETLTILIEILRDKTKEIKKELDIRCSELLIERRRKELADVGLERRLRVVTCPCCATPLDVSAFANTPEIYCRYCDRISDQLPEVKKKPKDVCLCEQCGYYSLPQDFTYLVFVFLLVFYYIESNTTKRCRNCMRGPAWTMLLVNCLGLICVPVAMFQLFRAYCMNPLRKLYPTLDQANRAAQAGHMEAAEESYSAILHEHPNVAGVHYNRALAYAKANRWDDSRAAAEEALASCANFQPAMVTLIIALRMLDRDNEIKTLVDQWDQMPV